MEVRVADASDDLVDDEHQKIGKDWSFYLHNLAATFAAHAA